MKGDVRKRKEQWMLAQQKRKPQFDDGQTTDGDHDQDVNVLNRCSMNEASSGTVSVVDFQ